MKKEAIQHGRLMQLPTEYTSLGRVLQHVATRHPKNGITYVDSQGNEAFISYPMVVSEALLRLNTLQESGVRAGDVVIVEIDNPKEFFQTFWACVFGGIIVVPVSQPISWEPGSDKLSKLFDTWNILKKPLILIDNKYEKSYTALKSSPLYADLQYLSVNTLQQNIPGKTASVHENDLAVLQFSSGSTGTPKGVELTHKNILTNVLALSRRFELASSDNTFSWLPHTHDMGLFCQYLTSVIAGCNQFIFSPSTFVRSPHLFLKKISEHKGTWFGSPNFGFDWMTKKISEKVVTELDLSSVRLALNGAEPISILVMNQFIEKFSRCGFKKIMMRPAYGMAEATVGVTVSQVGTTPEIETVDRSKLINNNIAVSVSSTSNAIQFVREGLPIDGVSIRIADEQGKTLLERQVGEIQIKGDCVTKGYYNNAEATARLFQNEWLRTGDLGFIHGGSLVVTGRIKDILFLRGQNYFAHDLEDIIYAHNIIPRGELVFVGVFNNELQKEELIAFVKHKGDISRLLQIRNAMLNMLSETLGIEITHVLPVSSIPKTTSGKLQRFQLRQSYEMGQYAEIIKNIASALVKKPSAVRQEGVKASELTGRIKKIWAKVLNIEEDKIALTDRFLSLGGNSVKAFEVLGQIEAYLKKEIDTEILVSCKTIQQMAEYIETMQKIPDSGDELNFSPDKNFDTEKGIAITGMALRLPNANNPNAFWDNLSAGKDSVAVVSEKRKKLSQHPEWNDWLAEVRDIDLFDNDFFEITPEEAVFLDPQQRLSLEVAYEALEDAGVVPSLEQEQNIGVYSGISTNTYYQLVVDYLLKSGMENAHQNTLIGNMCNMISATLSHHFNFVGPAFAVDSACSSFLVALHHAVKALREKTIQGALVISANILTTPIVHLLSKRAGILSSTRFTKVFDKEADGSVLGEGVLVFYLEPLKTAIDAKKNIYTVIRGTAVNNDGCSLGIMAPNPKAQLKVLLEAYKDANLSPGEMHYLEVHGTGTAIGDPIEMNTLSKLFSGLKKEPNSVGIGSVKTNLGHLLPAAGAAALAKVLLCFQHRSLVPSLHMKSINPSLRLETSPFYVVQKMQTWNIEKDKTRKAGISSFGLGGTNAHIVLEEWVADATKDDPNTVYLLTLSAKTKAALERMIQQMENTLARDHSAHVRDICFTRACQRKHYPYRATALVSDYDKEKKVYFELTQELVRKRKMTISIIVGDLKQNAFHQDAMVANEKIFTHMDKVFQEAFISFDETQQKQVQCFLYWFSIFKLIKASSKNIIQFYGTDSGSALCALLEDKLDLLSAVRAYLQPEMQNQILNIKADVVLTLGAVSRMDKIYQIENLVGIQRSSLYAIISQLYLLGNDFKWEKFYVDTSAHIVSLPFYPFEEKSFWIYALTGEKYEKRRDC